jgi:hypothetical protein
VLPYAPETYKEPSGQVPDDGPGEIASPWPPAPLPARQDDQAHDAAFDALTESPAGLERAKLISSRRIERPAGTETNPQTPLGPLPSAEFIRRRIMTFTPRTEGLDAGAHLGSLLPVDAEACLRLAERTWDGPDAEDVEGVLNVLGKLDVLNWTC